MAMSYKWELALCDPAIEWACYQEMDGREAQSVNLL
jgi:hypothetical protein